MCDKARGECRTRLGDAFAATDIRYNGGRQLRATFRAMLPNLCDNAYDTNSLPGAAEWAQELPLHWTDVGDAIDVSRDGDSVTRVRGGSGIALSSFVWDETRATGFAEVQLVCGTRDDVPPHRVLHLQVGVVTPFYDLRATHLGTRGIFFAVNVPHSRYTDAGLYTLPKAEQRAFAVARVGDRIGVAVDTRNTTEGGSVRFFVNGRDTGVGVKHSHGVRACLPLRLAVRLCGVGQCVRLVEAPRVPDGCE